MIAESMRWLSDVAGRVLSGRRNGRSNSSSAGFVCIAFVVVLLAGRPAMGQTNTPVPAINLGSEINDIINQNASNPTQAINNYMAGLAATNARWVRIDINWARIQPSQTSIDVNDPNPGSGSGLNWGVTDTVIRAARNNGLRVLGLILLTPP